MSEVNRFALWLALTAGMGEVAARVVPVQGLDPAHVLQLLAINVVLTAGWCGLAALAARRRRRANGWVLGAWLAMQALIAWRFAFVLNAFLKDPKVWAELAGAAAVGLLAGVLADPRLRRWMWAAPAVASVVAFVRAAPAPRPNPASGPSVLVVTLDTTRADRAWRDMPNLDRVAGAGVKFTQAITAAPITEPSHLAIMTGIEPYHSGVVVNGTDIGDRPALLARVLGQRGYTTAGFVSGFPLHSRYGWRQGMDVYDDDFGLVPGVETLSLVKLWDQVALPDHVLRERDAPRLASRAVPWLEAHRDETFFAWVHLFDAHAPYESPYNVELGPPPTDGPPLPLPAYWTAAEKRITDPTWLEHAYDGELRYADEALGEVIAALGDRLDDTIVVVTGDHGESLTEHGYYFDHGDDLFDPSLRVPLVVRYPRVAKAGLVVDCQVGTIDIAPTILAILGVDDGIARDGVPRLDELGGAPCRDRPMVSSTAGGRFVDRPPVDFALRGHDRKFIQKAGAAGQLYDLAADPGELHDLARESNTAPFAAALTSLTAGKADAAAPQADTTTHSMLKELGYEE